MGIMPSLMGRFIQFGYVARDLDVAKARFSERFGPCEFYILEGGNPDMPEILRVGLAFIGETMVEIIQADPSTASLYLDTLPQAHDEIRFHHLGFLVDDHAATVERLKAQGYDVPVDMSYGTILDCCYADTRAELGHYCEYIRLGDEGRELFKAVPGFVRLP